MKKKQNKKNLHILKLTDTEFITIVTALENQKYSNPSNKELKTYPKDAQIRIKLELEEINRLLKRMGVSE